MRLILLSSLLLLACSSIQPPASLAPAPKPLYRDPVFDGAADPSIVYNRAKKTWWMFYTNRRANVPGLSSVGWVHGTPIGIAESADGRIWNYKGTVAFPDSIPYTQGPGLATYWAPEVVDFQGNYHMYLTIVPGVFEDWNHPRRIVHLTSPDLLHWDYQSTLPLINEKVIDATLWRMPDGIWRLWYNNELAGKKTYYAESTDLYHWVDRGSARLPNERGEAPLVFFWQGYFWLINDLLGNNGLGVYRSLDADTWERQPQNLLDRPGQGRDDQNAGHHAEIVLNDGRAYLYYFVHPGVSDSGDNPDLKRSSIQLVELRHEQGWLRAERDSPSYINLKIEHNE